MEALRTHNDSLHWEVHRLDAKNQRFRSVNPEASDRLDLETELKRMKSDVVALTEQVQAYQRQLEELRERAGAETATDGRSTELELVWEELRTANEMAATERQKVVELERTLTTRDAEMDELEAARGDAERKLVEFRRDAEQELELTRQNADLECYRALDAERAKWEAREHRVLEQLDTTRRELDKHGVGLGSEMYATLRTKLITVEGQLQLATVELENNRTVVV